MYHNPLRRSIHLFHKVPSLFLCIISTPPGCAEAAPPGPTILDVMRPDMDGRSFSFSRMELRKKRAARRMF